MYEISQDTPRQLVSNRLTYSVLIVSLVMIFLNLLYSDNLVWYDRLSYAVIYMSGAGLGILLLYYRKRRELWERFEIAHSTRASVYNLVTPKMLATFEKGQYVYIIQDADVSRYCKIGRTNNPAHRIGRFEVIMPFRLAIVRIIPCDNMVGAESQLHRLFAEKRVEGEWFKLDDVDIMYLLSIQNL